MWVIVLQESASVRVCVWACCKMLLTAFNSRICCWFDVLSSGGKWGEDEARTSTNVKWVNVSTWKTAKLTQTARVLRVYVCVLVYLWLKRRSPETTSQHPNKAKENQFCRQDTNRNWTQAWGTRWRCQIFLGLKQSMNEMCTATAAAATAPTTTKRHKSLTMKSSKRLPWSGCLFWPFSEIFHTTCEATSWQTDWQWDRQTDWLLTDSHTWKSLQKKAHTHLRLLPKLQAYHGRGEQKRTTTMMNKKWWRRKYKMKTKTKNCQQRVSVNKKI